MTRSITLLASSMLVAINVHADVVVPVDSVERHVNVRMEADSASEIVGRLRQGESLHYERTEAGWHKVSLLDDAYGYVHADWGVVITDEAFAARQAGSAEDIAGDEQSPEAVGAAVASAGAASTEQAEIVNGVEESLPDETIEQVEATAASAEASSAETADDVPESALREVAAAATDAVAAEQDEATDVVAEDVAATRRNEPAVDESIEPARPADATAVPALVTTVVGPPGPPGPQGPPGPASKVNIEGTVDHLMKFTKSTVGGNSQVFDDGNNVGIGTTEPKQRLEVNGNIQIHERNSNVAALMLTQSSGDTGYIMHNRANTLTIGAGSVDRMTIDRDGNIGIGLARPSHPIEMASGAYVSAGGVWTNSSSRSRKQDIVELQPEEAVAALRVLRPVRFRYRNDESEEYVGFIAEDVPELVANADRESLSAMDVVAVLTTVVQQQQQQIEDLERRLQELPK